MTAFGRDESSGDASQSASDPGRRRHPLAIACNVAIAPLLLAPLGIAVVTRDVMIFAFSALAAVVVVRALVLTVVPWLEGEGDGAGD